MCAHRNMTEEKKNRIILGLDISTSTIGVAVVLDDGSDLGKIIELTHIAPKIKNVKGIESLFLKKKAFQEEFIDKWKDCGITDVVIEEPLLRSNNVSTCAQLLRFNSMIADAVYTSLNIVPKFISSYHARLFAFPELYNIRKFKKNGEQYDLKKILNDLNHNKFALFGSYQWDIDKKQVLQGKVSSLFPEIQWLYNKKGELKQENYDSVDAYVCVLGMLNMERHPNENDDIDMKVVNVSNDGNNRIEFDVEYWGKVEHRKLELN